MKYKEFKRKIDKCLFDTFSFNNTQMSMNNTPIWDSLKHIQLISSLELEFGIDISHSDEIKMMDYEIIVKIMKKYVEVHND